MKTMFSLEELIDHFTLTPDDLALLEGRTTETKLLLAVTIKTLALDGALPSPITPPPPAVIAFVAVQLKLEPSLYTVSLHAQTTSRRVRDAVRVHLGYRVFTVDDARDLRTWLQTRFADKHQRPDAIRTAALERLKELRIEPPSNTTLERAETRARREAEMIALRTLDGRLNAEQRTVLQAMLEPHAPVEERLRINAGDETDPADLEGKVSLFHELRVDANAPGIDSVRQQIAKLNRIRTLKLSAKTFEGVGAHFITRWRERASLEAPSQLRRHSPTVRHALMSALCHQRHGELIDSLIDHLLHSVQTLTRRAERRVEAQMIEEFKRVSGKGQLLFRIAEVALEQPDASIRGALYPVVGEGRLKDIVGEYRATRAAFRGRVQHVKRNAYRGGYRRVVPLLLNALEFRSNNTAHQPVIEALDLIFKHAETMSAPYYPVDAAVPLDGLLSPSERSLVLEEQQGVLLVNRVNYELFVIEKLRAALRCREVWVVGANRYRNSDEDLPQDFAERRDEYYAALRQPTDAQAFVSDLRTALESALRGFNDALPDNQHVAVLERDDGWFKVSPLEAQPEPAHLNAFKADLGGRWPMTGLLDFLKEAELRVSLSDRFQSLGAFETIDRDVLRQRVLLTVYALGTNIGLKRMAGAESGVSYAELRHVRRRFVHRDALRAANADLVNATLRVRDPAIWGEGATACASDSRQFGAWDQNLTTEYHRRYGGRGIMVYWHVERKSLCVHSQIKAVSPSEVAAMIEGVLRHCTDAEIERNYTDSHGQSEVGFAFSHCLGFRLMPRLKNIGGQRLYVSDPELAASLPNLRPVLRRAIDWGLIAQQYEEIVKLATSLRLGVADAESVLRRFTRANAQHPTYRALVELGKAVKTIFLCEYLSSMELRREIHEALNVVENWNSANSFIFFGKGGEFQSNRFEEQEISMLCMHLLQNCLVFVNTLMVQELLEDPVRRARLDEADWRALTPLMYHHVNPYGVYTLDFGSRILFASQERVA